MLVVLHHLYFSNTQLGPFGVKIFFVISGFVMWITTAETDISPVSFWRRRLIRIVPMYWLFISLFVAIFLFRPQYFNSTALTPENVFKSFLFIPHYHAIQKFIAPILIPGWSLNYEVFFYLIFGLVLFIKLEYLRAISACTIFAGLVLIGFVLKPQDAIAVTYTSPDLLLFIEGLLLGVIYRSLSQNGPYVGSVLVGSGALLCVVGLAGRVDGFS